MFCENDNEMLKHFAKSFGIFGYIVQYGCWTHCVFEYIGDFVIVSQEEGRRKSVCLYVKFAYSVVGERIEMPYFFISTLLRTKRTTDL